MRKKIVVWYNPHKKYYYYKIVSFHYRPYELGVTNSYGHVIVLVIPNIKKLEFYKTVPYVFYGIDWFNKRKEK